MAEAAEQGGAVGIRADGPADISEINSRVDLPIIGIYKRRDLSEKVYITPDLSSAGEVIEAGTDILAIDGTARERPGGMNLEELIGAIKDRWELPIMADVSTEDEGVEAERLGADLVATTLSGYTPYTEDKMNGPDLDLVRKLARKTSIPVIAEGRYSEPEELLEAILSGAHAVVIGTAITNPIAITRKFVEKLGHPEC